MPPTVLPNEASNLLLKVLCGPCRDRVYGIQIFQSLWLERSNSLVLHNVGVQIPQRHCQLLGLQMC